MDEILSQITEREYRFNPKVIILDKNGANYCAIKHVFGVDFMTSKVASCQVQTWGEFQR